MKPFLASLAILLCLTMPISGTAQVTEPAPAEAQIVLVAPHSARVGELVRLDVSESSADSFKWILVPDSVDFLVYDSGARAVFSARMEGEYRFIVACAKDGTVDVVTHVVRILGPPPMPVSDSLAEWIPFWNWAEMLPSEQCQLLAASFESIAARVGELEKPEDWMKATAEANRKVLGDDLTKWKPMLDKIGAALLKKAETGALATPEDHQKAWLEVAKGLRNC